MPYRLALCVLCRTYRQDHETLFHVVILSKHHHHHHQVDKGIKPLAGTNGECVTQGIDDLGKYFYIYTDLYENIYEHLCIYLNL
jgi:hypothetical protein